MNFIDYLEHIYQTEDIYRAIIVITGITETTNYNKIQNLIKDLKIKNHEPILITDEINEIDYNYRLFIMKNPNNLNKFQKNSYNLIIIY